MVEALLDSGTTVLVMSSEFSRKQKFKLKKMESLIYVKNIDGFFNKEKPIKHIVEVNIYYQRYRERMEIDIIGEQKQSVILNIPWLACHNLEINWKTEEVKMMRMSRRVQKAVETKTGKIRMAKAERRRKKEGRRK